MGEEEGAATVGQGGDMDERGGAKVGESGGDDDDAEWVYDGTQGLLEREYEGDETATQQPPHREQQQQQQQATKRKGRGQKRARKE